MSIESMGKDQRVVLRDCCRGLSGEVQIYYLLLATSGLRSSELYTILKTPLVRRNVRIIQEDAYDGMKTKVVRLGIECGTFSKPATKYYYFPYSLKKVLYSFTLTYKQDYYERTIRETGGLSVSDIRAWNNSVLSEYLNVVDMQYVLKGIATAEDDETVAMRGAVAYSRAVDRLLLIMPIPESVQNCESIKAAIKSRKTKKTVKTKTLEALLERDPATKKYRHTHREIIRDTGVSARYLKTLVKENNLQRA